MTRVLTAVLMATALCCFAAEGYSAPGDQTGSAPATPPATAAPAAAPSTSGNGPSIGGGGNAASDETLPEVEYDFSKLPEPVKRLREQLIAAASTGDPEALRPIIQANQEPPTFSNNQVGDPIDYLKSLSGDPDGREILAILLDVLEAGYVHVEAGTPDEVYLWPYFARYPVDKLTPRQMVELFRIIYSGDFDDMKEAGHYLFYRVGISPDGQWKYFNSED